MTVDVARDGTEAGRSAAQRVDDAIARHGGWRSETLRRLRTLVREADPEVTEDVKWRKPSNGMCGVPVWERHGLICTGEAYKAAVKLTFARGASLDDPLRLFNASLDGGTRRAIDLREGEAIDEPAFKALIRAAVAANREAGARTKRRERP